MNNLNEIAKEYGLEDAIVFTAPSYDEAIIGFDAVQSRFIYDYDRMVEVLAERDGISTEDAITFIEYNTLRACAYMDNPPVVLKRIE
jgi:hypothetical protein